MPNATRLRRRLRLLGLTERCLLYPKRPNSGFVKAPAIESNPQFFLLIVRFWPFYASREGQQLADFCDLVSASDLTKLNLFQGENLSKPEIESSAEPREVLTNVDIRAARR